MKWRIIIIAVLAFSGCPIALSAAETGHLVLTTLHTIDSASTINRIVGMFELEAGIGGGVDFMIATASSPVIPRSALTRDRVDVAPFFSAMAGVRFHPTPSSGVMLRVLLDVDPARRRYVSNIGGETTYLAVPWAVRPMVQLGFSFDLVRAP